MNLATLTDDDLHDLRQQVLTEVERRATLASAPAQVEQICRAWADARGRQDGDPWQQPVGAHDVYGPGAVVTHKGKVWDNAHGVANAWEPGVYGWTARG